MSPSVAACSRCGLVWGEVNVGQLHRHLESFPTDELAHWLRSPHDGPI
jgi:hypothetical protein